MLQVLNHKYNQTTLIVVFCTGFLGGLLLGRGAGQSSTFLPISILLALATLRRRKFVALLAFALLGLNLGLLRSENFSTQLEPYEQLYGQQVLLTVEAQSDAIYATGGQLEFDAGKVALHQPYATEVPGSMKIQGFGVPAVSRGDTLQVSGKLYPSGGSRQAKMNFAELTLLHSEDSVIESIRKRFVSGMFSAVPEPQASFGLGLLIGQRTTLRIT